MITDLRIGNCIVIQRNSEYHAGIIQTLGDTKCSVKDQSDKTMSLPYDNFRPAKITKRWLHDNEFDDIDEGTPEGQPVEEPGSSARFVHRSLPISYSHGDHRLYVYGHIFPVKVVYVHHIQNALIDCGISFEPVFRDSHCTQVDGCPIVQLLGGMKKSPEFFDTNAAFGFSGMPKLKVVQSGKAMSNRKPAFPHTMNFKHSFVSIAGIIDEGVRSLAEYFYDNVAIDRTGNFTITELIKIGPDAYVFTSGAPGNSQPLPWEVIIRFINSYSEIVRDIKFKLAIGASGEVRDRLLEGHPEVLLNAEICSEFSLRPGNVKFVYTLGRRDDIQRVDVKGWTTGTLYRNVPAYYIEFLAANVGNVTFEECDEEDFERFEGRPTLRGGDSNLFNYGASIGADKTMKAEEAPGGGFPFNGPVDENLVDDDLNFGDFDQNREAQEEQQMGDAIDEAAVPRAVERGPEPEIYMKKKTKKNRKSSRGI
jgi:hypothetical protein